METGRPETKEQQRRQPTPRLDVESPAVAAAAHFDESVWQEEDRQTLLAEALLETGPPKAQEEQHRERAPCLDGGSRAAAAATAADHFDEGVWQADPPFEQPMLAVHLSGDCRPCPWFWRPGGCHNGDGCAHCHFCHAGADADYLRAKMQRRRARRRAFERLVGQ